MNISRQVARAEARKNDYWVTGTRGLMVPRKARDCQLVSATNRGRVSIKVIAAKQPRKRLAKPKDPRHPTHLRHAWQRKRAAADALRKALAPERFGS